jgi:hypothetical protein
MLGDIQRYILWLYSTECKKLQNLKFIQYKGLDLSQSTCVFIQMGDAQNAFKRQTIIILVLAFLHRNIYKSDPPILDKL